MANQASDPETRSLCRLARFLGVQTRYRNTEGTPIKATPDALLAVLPALGCPLKSPAEAANALRGLLAERRERILDPVLVAWDGRLTSLSLRLPATDHSVSAAYCLTLENGDEHRGSRPARRITRERQGGSTGDLTHRIDWRTSLPLGYHALTLRVGRATARTLIISAPERVWEPPHPEKRWGIFAPLYALHSDQSWGAGDYRDLRTVTEWLRQQGGGVTATLPLLPTFLNTPFDPSPYSPISRLFWNEFYLAIEELPEWKNCAKARRLAESPAFLRDLRRCRNLDTVDYRTVMALKEKVLAPMAESFFRSSGSRREAFERYRKEHPLLEDYARFRAGQPSHTATPTGNTARKSSVSPISLRHHLYTQWAAHEQLRAVAHTTGTRRSSLYLDLPLGVHPDGFDPWRFPDIFATATSTGAPPDTFFTLGQNWGFAPLHPDRLRESGYAYWRMALQHHLRVAGILRLDHVMALHRLFWIPQGVSARDGVYVRYHAEELMAVLTLESRRHRSLIAGENLGTVPAAVHRSMARHGLRGLYVMQYEFRDQGKSVCRRPPAQVVASLNTHDMPTFAAYWAGADIRLRRSLGLMRVREETIERRQREKLKGRIRAQLRRMKLLKRGETDPEAVLRALLGVLGNSAAETALLALEDLWLEPKPQNVPGTSTECPNWQRKTRFALADWMSHEDMKRSLDRIRKTRSHRKRVKL